MQDYQKQLFPYAYNILGSSDDALDAIQDVMSNYSAGKKDHIENTKNYLIRGVINQSINLKNKKKKTRFGEVWLPEPIATETADNNLHLEDIVSYSMLLLLEKLNPKERAVFVLKEAFSYSHEEIADFLSSSVENSRKILSRAKSKLQQQPGQQNDDSTGLHLNRTMTNATDMLNRFVAAIRNRDTAKLESLFAQDISFLADGGPNMNVTARSLSGLRDVSALLMLIYEKYQVDYVVKPTIMNHQQALLYYSGDELISCQVFNTTAEGMITQINTVLDPEKLKFIRELHTHSSFYQSSSSS